MGEKYSMTDKKDEEKMWENYVWKG